MNYIIGVSEYLLSILQSSNQSENISPSNLRESYKATMRRRGFIYLEIGFVNVEESEW